MSRSHGFGLAVLLATAAAVAQPDLLVPIEGPPAAPPPFGGFGPPVAAGPAGRSLAGETLMTGDGMHLLISPDKKRAWAYSIEKGEWKRVPLDGPIATTPVMSAEVIVVVDGRKVHAFGRPTGEWRTLELPEGAAPLPTVGRDSAEVRTPAAVSIFSARTGTWATVRFAD